MANIVAINVKDRNVFVELKINENELKLVQSASFDILLAPTDPQVFNQTLTTGTLGNSHRIMLPKKILRKFEIKEVPKKVPCSVFDFNNSKYLVIKLEEKKIGVPKFRVDEDA